MHLLKSSLVACFSVGLLGATAVVGCSADGGGDFSPALEVDPTEGSGGSESRLPPSDPGDEDSSMSVLEKKDAGQKDGSADAAKDSGPPAPKSGDPCNDGTKLYEAPCGKCGKWQLRCIIPAGAASGTLSEPSACSGELTSSTACVPGATEACDKCAVKTCSNTCVWSTCSSSPPNACNAGEVEYTTAGCSAGTYASKSCMASCTWAPFTATCFEPNNPNKLAISPAVNSIVGGSYTLVATRVGRRTSWGCGAATSMATPSDYPYEIIELQNPTALAATLHLWLTGPTPIGTTISAFPNNIPPQTDEALKSCTRFNSSGGWATLSSVTIPANGKIVVRVTAFQSLATTTTTTGSFTLNVRTDTLK